MNDISAGFVAEEPLEPLRPDNEEVADSSLLVEHKGRAAASVNYKLNYETILHVGLYLESICILHLIS